jgi:hypothetical protein
LEVLEIFAADTASLRVYFDDQVMARLLGRINAPDVANFFTNQDDPPKHFTPIAIFLKSMRVASIDVISAWAKKLGEIAKLAESDGNDLLSNYCLRCVSESIEVLVSAESSDIEMISEWLRALFDEDENSETLLWICRVLWALHPHVSNQEQVEIVGTFSGSFFPGAPIEHVAELLAEIVDGELETAVHSELESALKGRLLADPDPANRVDTVRFLLKSLGIPGESLMMGALTLALDGGDLPTAINLISDSSKHFRKPPPGKKSVEPLLNGILDKEEQAPDGQTVNQLLTLTLRLKDWHKKDFEERFATRLATRAVSSDEQIHKVALDTAETALAELALSPKNYSAVLAVATVFLVSQNQARPLDAQELRVLQMATTEGSKVLAIPNLIKSIAAWASGQIASQPDLSHKLLVVEAVSYLDGVPREALEDLIVALAGGAENSSGPDDARPFEDALLNLMSSHSDLDREVWEKFDEYRKKLERSSDQDVRERGKDLRHKIANIRRAATTASG